MKSAAKYSLDITPLALHVETRQRRPLASFTDAFPSGLFFNLLFNVIQRAVTSQTGQQEATMSRCSCDFSCALDCFG